MVNIFQICKNRKYHNIEEIMENYNFKDCYIGNMDEHNNSNQIIIVF
jgi:hypothetical protein